MSNSTFTVGTPTPSLQLSQSTTIHASATATKSDGAAFHAQGTQSAYECSLQCGIGLGVGIPVGILLLLGIWCWIWLRRKCPTGRPENVDSERMRHTAFMGGSAHLRQEAFDRLVRPASMQIQNITRRISKKMKNGIQRSFKTSPRRDYLDVELDGYPNTQGQSLGGLRGLLEPANDSVTFIENLCRSPTWDTVSPSEPPQAFLPPSRAGPPNPDLIVADPSLRTRHNYPSSVTAQTGSDVHLPIAASMTSLNGEGPERAMFNTPLSRVSTPEHQRQQPVTLADLGDDGATRVTVDTPARYPGQQQYSPRLPPVPAQTMGSPPRAGLYQGSPRYHQGG